MSPQIKIAVAAALAAAAGAAQATDIQFFNAATAVVVNVSGSTAVDNTLFNSTLLKASGGLCNNAGAAGTVAVGDTAASNTVDTYTVKNANGAVTNRFTFCNASAHAGVPAGTPLIIVKESNGGSGNGIHPVANGTTLQFLDAATVKTAEGLTDATCTNTVQPASASGNLLAYAQHDNCGAGLTVAKVPTGGVADVEGNLLAPAASTAELALVNAKPGLAVVWGVSVTKSLYYALQHAEGLDVAAAPCNVVNNDNPLCAPTLTKAQVTGVYNGSITDWSQLELASGAKLSVPGNQAAYVCRRDNGSGTEASFEYYYLNARCSSADLAMASESGANIGYVFTNTSTGDVRNCLEAANWGSAAYPYTSDVSGGLGGNVSAFPVGSWALGVISTEVLSTDLAPSTKAGSTANPALDDFFRFVKVDNALPTLENVVNGRWDHFSEDVLYINKTTSVAAGTPGQAFTVGLEADIATPLLISESDSAFENRPWGDGGDLVPSTSTLAVQPVIPATQATINANPTNSLSKALGNAAGTPNNCDPAEPNPAFFTLTSAQ